jgi:hypothetical protein
MPIHFIPQSRRISGPLIRLGRARAHKCMVDEINNVTSVFSYLYVSQLISISECQQYCIYNVVHSVPQNL